MLHAGVEATGWGTRALPTLFVAPFYQAELQPYDPTNEPALDTILTRPLIELHGACAQPLCHNSTTANMHQCQPGSLPLVAAALLHRLRQLTTSSAREPKSNQV